MKKYILLKKKIYSLIIINKPVFVLPDFISSQYEFVTMIEKILLPYSYVEIDKKNKVDKELIIFFFSILKYLCFEKIHIFFVFQK